MVQQREILSDKNQQAKIEIENIRKKFAKHDINVLGLKKPKLIENIINKGTKRVMADLTQITNPETFYENGRNISSADS